jgi:hypothetical protein
MYIIPYDIHLQSHHRVSTYHEVAAHLMKRLMDQKDNLPAGVTVGWDSVPPWVQFALCIYLHLYDMTLRAYIHTGIIIASLQATRQRSCHADDKRFDVSINLTVKTLSFVSGGIFVDSQCAVADTYVVWRERLFCADQPHTGFRISY